MSEHEPGSEQESKGSDSKASTVELYEKMSKIFREKFERAGSLSEEAFEKAMSETREWGERMRDNYGDDVSKVTEFIRRDWHDAIRFTREQTRRSFDLERLQAGAMDLISRLAKSAGTQLEDFASRISERLTYKTGEIAGAGTLQCIKCEQNLILDKATRIPPCPKCHNTLFRRSY